MLRKLCFLLIGVTSLIGLGGCKKNTGAVAGSSQTLQAYFSNAVKFTLFDKALQKTQLDTLLGGDVPYTVFAPNDSAMIASGFNADRINQADPVTLRGIISYHLVQGDIFSTDVNLYKQTQLTMADSAYNAYLEYNNYGLFINGIRLLSVDTKLNNGVVHEIQGVAIPPVGDILTTLAQHPELSDFNFAISYPGASFLYSSLQLPNVQCTVLAPDNAAFAAAGIDNIAVIQSKVSSGYWYTFLPFVNVGTQYFTSDFLGTFQFTAIDKQGNNRGSIDFSADGLTATGLSLAGVIQVDQTARVVHPNIIATNGVIHIIDHIIP